MKRKVAIITGGNRGIGASISTILAKQNYDLVIVYHNDIDSANKLKKDLQDKYHNNILLVQADISKEEDVLNILKRVKETYDTLDILINNAGISIDTTIEDKTVNNFKKILDVNLIGTFLMCKYIGKEMLNNKEGCIVNISSNSAIDDNYPFGMDYDASKAGVISLTHNFARLYAPYIRVNTIAPGWVNTDMNKEMDEEFKKEQLNHILINRFAEPEEIAEAVLFCSKSTYLNDAIIKIDGGHY